MDEILINSFSSNSLNDSSGSSEFGEINLESSHILDTQDFLVDESLDGVNLSLDSDSAILSVSLESESQTDIYESLLVEDELNTVQSFFLKLHFFRLH